MTGQPRRSGGKREGAGRPLVALVDVLPVPRAGSITFIRCAAGKSGRCALIGRASCAP